MNDPVDLLIVATGRMYAYSGGGAVMADKLIESVERTCEQGSYRLRVAESDGEPWAVTVNRLLAETTGPVVHLDEGGYCGVPGWLETFRQAQDLLRREALLCGKVSFPQRDEAGVDTDSYQPGRLHSAGLDLIPGGGCCFAHYDRSDPGWYRQFRDVACAGWDCVWLNRAFLDECGGLDESFSAGAHAAAVDLSLRAWRGGWTVGYVPGPHTLHYGLPARAEEPGGDDWAGLLEKQTVEFYEHIRRDRRSVVPR